jgi:serine phosphatase RsbU (regulator of sigma subunit)
MATLDVNSAATPSSAVPEADAVPRAPGDPLDLVLQHLRHLVRADAAMLLGLDRGRTHFEPIASWFSSPELAAVLTPGMHRPYSRDKPWLSEAALERGRPLLLPRLEDWEAAGHPREGLVAATDDEAWESIRRASVIACPVRTGLGRTLGTLIVVSLDQRRALGKADLDIVTVLADLAALARERSELLATQAAQGREEILLKRAAEATAGTLEPQEVELQVISHAVEITGADRAQLSRIQAGSQRLVTVAGEGAPGPVDPSTVREVVRTRAPVTRDGAQPSIHVPVELGPRLFGVLSLVRDSGADFDRDDLELVLKIARIAAAALANAHDFQQERHLARTLTHGFVPTSLPRVPGWDVGVLYEPADDQPTGGDLYGAWPLPDGDVAVLIGDVVGKGIETAALSAMARFFIEARSWDCGDPAAVLEQASTMLASRLPGDRFVTVFFGFLGKRHLRYSNAGHLAPIVLRADGSLEEATVGGLPLGIDERPGYREHTLELGPDDVLVAFTDGIIEARREGRLLGDDGLKRFLSEAGATTREPQALTELLHDKVRAWARGLSDDAAIVALRRRGLALIDGSADG